MSKNNIIKILESTLTQNDNTLLRIEIVNDKEKFGGMLYGLRFTVSDNETGSSFDTSEEDQKFRGSSIGFRKPFSRFSILISVNQKAAASFSNSLLIYFLLKLMPITPPSPPPAIDSRSVVTVLRSNSKP